MSNSKNKIIGITMGDPAGIGPEVIARSLLEIPARLHNQLLVIGQEDCFRSFWPGDKSLPPILNLPFGGPFTAGKATSDSARASLHYLDKSIEMLKSGSLSALVTGPVTKEGVSEFVPGFKGHTTYLANAFGLKNVEMVFVADSLRMVLVTRHIPLKDVPAQITREKIMAVIITTGSFLKDKFRIASPKIAVCGLNPHAGEGGHIGDEEIRHVVPALKELKGQGWDVVGPLAADTLFEPRNRQGYDLIVSMYHDQGLTALKSLYFDKLVNLTVGLPVIRTSPAHGTAFGIAGRNVADHRSMLASIRLAAELL